MEKQDLEDVLRTQRVFALAQAWRWVRDAGSHDEAGDMVVECLKKLGDPIELLDDVIREAGRWDAVVST